MTGTGIRQLYEQPVFISALGIAPLAAKSLTVLSALVIGLVWSLVFLLSSVTVAALRKVVPHAARLPFILLITSTWISLADLLLQAWFYEMRAGLDIYLPLIALNSLAIMLLEEKMLRTPVTGVLKPALFHSSGVLIIVLSVGLLREVLTHGRLFTDAAMLHPALAEIIPPFLPRLFNLPLFGSAAGAFLVIGCVLALVNCLRR